MTQVLISAAHKSSGKTTICIGLCAALVDRGLTVAAFKKGPDYIDPMWLGSAAGRPCYNLDFYTMSPAEIVSLYQQQSAGLDIRIIEGNKGLYDGLDLDGSNSNAALANLLRAPVVLVIDAQGMTRGIAPLILGYQAFDPQLKIAGVILNKLGGSRHESKLRQVIEHYTDVPVIGAVHREPSLQILERHLGLIPSNESLGAKQQITAIAKIIQRQVDLQHFLPVTNAVTNAVTNVVAHAAANAPTTDRLPIAVTPRPAQPVQPLRIGIARDSAFGFYYPDDLDAFPRAGARLVPLDLLNDARLPPLDGLFIGGGFPETHLQQLHANTALRLQIRHAIDAGLPVYAECGGLMYLTRRIRFGDQCLDMVGAIPADTVMHERPQGRGYVKLRARATHLWPLEQETTEELPGHEFHYSALENVDPHLQYAYSVLRGAGVDGSNDGIMINNMLACYSHMRNVSSHRWVEHFVQFVRERKAAKLIQHTHSS